MSTIYKAINVKYTFLVVSTQFEKYARQILHSRSHGPKVPQLTAPKILVKLDHLS